MPKLDVDSQKNSLDAATRFWIEPSSRRAKSSSTWAVERA
jgi:hypothetical protein